MQPVIVMPMHDPHGLMFAQLEAITPQLKSIFAQAFVSVTPITGEAQAACIKQCEADKFFTVLALPTNLPVGDEFRMLYAHAAAACQPNTILHLCFIDRVAFTLQSQHRAQFIAALEAVQAAHTPLIFERSSAAWETHPHNYRKLEQIVTHVGELLLNKSLDFAWCHLAVQAHQLHAVLPSLKRHDLSMVAELVLRLADQIQTQEVDWLAWEDPFIYAQDPQQLKREREQSVTETRKRLAYIIPMLQLLNQAACE